MKGFGAFLALINDVSLKAFGNDLKASSTFQISEYTTLETKIKDQVGFTISEPTLAKYFQLAREGNISGVRIDKLDTLARYVRGAPKEKKRKPGDYSFWIDYQKDFHLQKAPIERTTEPVVSKNESKKRGSLKTPLSKRILSILGVVLLLVFLFLLNRKPSKQIENPEQELVVALNIGNREFARWLEKELNQKFPEYNIQFPSGGLNGHSKDKMESFLLQDSEKKIDLFIGGNVAFYEKNVAELKDLREIIPLISDSIPYFDKRFHKWIGFYQKRLGCVWDGRLVKDTIKSIYDLFQDYPSEVLIPKMATSASYDLLIALSNSKGSLKFENGRKRYINLAKKTWYENYPSEATADVIAKYSPVLGVSWPHDAITVAKGSGYSCLKMAIFEESVTTLSCLGVRQKDMKEGTLKLLQFLLSEKFQTNHFNKYLRFPVHKNAFQKCIKQLTEEGFLVHYPEDKHSVELDYDIINLHMKELETSNYLPKQYILTFDKRNNSKNQSGCSPLR